MFIWPKSVCNINTSHGDLINEIYLLVTLPSISLTNYSMQFRWKDFVGFKIINYIEFFIDDDCIQKIPGKYLELHYKLLTQKKNISQMIGYNFPLLNDFSSFKNEYTLHIPIPFYFCLDSSLSLPILKLKEKNVRIYVHFNNLHNILDYTPYYKFRISETNCLLNKFDTIYQNNNEIGTFINFDEENQFLYYGDQLSSGHLHMQINNHSFYKNMTDHILKKIHLYYIIEKRPGLIFQYQNLP